MRGLSYFRHHLSKYLARAEGLSRSSDHQRADHYMSHAQIAAILELADQVRVNSLIALEAHRWQRVDEVGNYFGPDLIWENSETEYGSRPIKKEYAAILGLDIPQKEKNDE